MKTFVKTLAATGLLAGSLLTSQVTMADTNIYVGNVPFSMTSEEIRDMFAQYGEVTSVNLITDRETGRPRGFGFVEMKNYDDASKAIVELHGTQAQGRTLMVNEARPRPPRGEGSRGERGGRW